MSCVHITLFHIELVKTEDVHNINLYTLCWNFCSLSYFLKHFSISRNSPLDFEKGIVPPQLFGSTCPSCPQSPYPQHKPTEVSQKGWSKAQLTAPPHQI